MVHRNTLYLHLWFIIKDPTQEPPSRCIGHSVCVGGGVPTFQAASGSATFPTHQCFHQLRGSPKPSRLGVLVEVSLYRDDWLNLGPSGRPQSPINSLAYRRHSLEIPGVSETRHKDQIFILYYITAWTDCPMSGLRGRVPLFSAWAEFTDMPRKDKCNLNITSYHQQICISSNVFGVFFEVPYYIFVMAYCLFILNFVSIVRRV